MSEQVLVVGGTGFIGSGLTRRLSADAQREVTVFTRTVPAVPCDNVTYVAGDRRQGFAQLEGKAFDLVYDLCGNNPKTVAELQAEVKTKFTVHLGSAAAYGSLSTLPIAENHPLGGPLCDDYGRRKAACEAVLEDSGKPFTSLRATYVLGPDNSWPRESLLYPLVVAGETITVPGDGLAPMQFVSVREVAHALYLLGTERIEDTYNCAGDTTTDAIDLMQRMGAVAGREPIIATGGPERSTNFPFPNKPFVFNTSRLIEATGIEFLPLQTVLEQDWNSDYSHHIPVSALPASPK